MANFTDHAPYSFRKFVNSFGFMSIPDYQRAYAWKQKDINNFFSAVSENERDYFVGIVVASETEDSGLEIVDGQQRITTISLMLAALRALLIEGRYGAGEEIDRLKRNINEQIEKYDADSGEHLIVLRPGRESLRTVYNSLLNSKSTSPDVKIEDKVQATYLNNYLSLSLLIQSYTGTDKDKVKELYEKIVSLQFIVLTLKNEDDLQEIYDGLNSTGLGLSVAEQLKNKILQRAKKLDIKSDLEVIWDEMEQVFAKLNPSLFPKYLRHYWIATREYIFMKHLYGRMREDIKDLDSIQLTSWIEKLNRTAKLYCLIYTGKSENFVSTEVLDEFPKKFRESILRFRVLDNVQIYPAILAICQRFKDGGLEESRALQILEALWNFCLRTIFVSISPSAYEKVLADLAKIIREEESEIYWNKAQKKIESLAELVNYQKQFIKTFSGELSYKSDSQLITLIFEKFLEKEQPTIRLTDKNIEHILPQKPQKWGFTQKQIKDFVHNIGNLTILHPIDNRDVGNESFDVKKESFKNSHFESVRQIVKYDDFPNNPKAAIERRAIDIATRVWEEFRVSLR